MPICGVMKMGGPDGLQTELAKMRTCFIKPAATAALRAIVLAGVPALMLTALPLSLPFCDGDTWLSTAHAKSGGSDDGGSDDGGSDSDDSDNSGSGSDDDSSNSGSGSGNSGSGSGKSGSGSDDDDDDDDDKFSGDPTPESGDLSAADELWLIQHGWKKAESK